MAEPMAEPLERMRSNGFVPSSEPPPPISSLCLGADCCCDVGGGRIPAALGAGLSAVDDGDPIGGLCTTS